MASSAFILNSQAMALKQGSSFLQCVSGTSCTRLRGGNAGSLRMHARQCRSKRGLSIMAVAESPEETAKDEPEFKLKIDYEDEATAPAPDKSKWTGYVMKDTAGQENIYSVEPTVYVAESILSTNSKGSGGSSSSTVAFVGTAVLFTLLAGGSAINISQYKADVTAAGNMEEYSGPPLSYYMEKFSEPSTPAPDVADLAEDTDAAPAPEVVPFILDTSVPSDLLSVGHFKQFRSPLTPLAVSFTEGVEAPALKVDLPTAISSFEGVEAPALKVDLPTAAPEEAVTEARVAESVAPPVLVAEALPSAEPELVATPAPEAATEVVNATTSPEDSAEGAAPAEAGEPRVALAGPTEGSADEPSIAPEVVFEYNEAELPPELPAEDLASFVEVSDDGGESSMQNPLRTTIEE